MHIFNSLIWTTLLLLIMCFIHGAWAEIPFVHENGTIIFMTKNVIETMDCEITVSTVMGIAYCKAFLTVDKKIRSCIMSYVFI